MTTELTFTTIGDGPQRFRVADVGEGPVVVLVHGFPDTPHSWSITATRLVDAGYRVVVPWLRGYHRDTIVEGRRYTADMLGDDLVVLLDTMGVDEAVLVGHDWGASCVWNAFEQAPDRVRAVVPIAIPHPSRLKPDLVLAWRGRHFAALKLPAAGARLRLLGSRYVDTLYRRWSPRWRDAEQQAAVARVKAAFSDPVVADHAARWYGDLKPGGRRPAPFPKPALLVMGAEDFGGDTEPYRRTQALFADGVMTELLVLEGAGHWPHRERQSEFDDALVSFLGSLDG